jgi:hypothetical protein
MADSTEGKLSEVFEIALDLTSFETGIKTISVRFDSLLNSAKQMTQRMNSTFMSMNDSLSKGGNFTQMESSFNKLLEVVNKLDSAGSAHANYLSNYMKSIQSETTASTSKLKDFIKQMEFVLKAGGKAIHPDLKMQYTADLTKAKDLLGQVNAKQKELNQTMTLAKNMDISQSINKANEASVKLRENFTATMNKMKENIGNIKFSGQSDMISVGDAQKRLNQAKAQYQELEKITKQFTSQITKLETERDNVALAKTKETDEQRLKMLNNYFNQLQSKIKEMKNLESTMNASTPKVDFGGHQTSISNQSQQLVSQFNSSGVSNIEQQLKQMQEVYNKVRMASKDTSLANYTDLQNMKEQFQLYAGSYRANIEKIIQAQRDLRAAGRERLIDPATYEQERAKLAKLLAEYDKFGPKIRSMGTEVNSTIRLMGNEVDKGLFQKFNESMRQIRWQTATMIYLVSRGFQGFKSLVAENLDMVSDFRRKALILTTELGMYAITGLKDNWDEFFAYSMQAMAKLQAVSTESLASFEDLNRIMKVLGQRGIFPKNDEDMKAIGTIGTAIKSLTEGATASGFKMEKEIRDVLMVLEKPTDRLINMFKMVGINLKEGLKDVKPEDFLQKMQSLLQPYATLNEKLSQEYGTQVKRLGEMWDYIKRIALTPIVKEVAEGLKSFTDSLGTVGGLLSAKGQALSDMMHNIYEMIKEVIVGTMVMISSILGYIFGIGNQIADVFKGIQDGMGAGATKAQTFKQTCEAIGVVAKKIGDAFRETSKLVSQFFDAEAGHGFVETIAPVVKDIAKIMAEAFIIAVKDIPKNIMSKDWKEIKQKTPEDREKDWGPIGWGINLHQKLFGESPSTSMENPYSVPNPSANYKMPEIKPKMETEEAEKETKKFISETEESFEKLAQNIKDKTFNAIETADWEKIDQKLKDIQAKSMTGYEQIAKKKENSLEVTKQEDTLLNEGLAKVNKFIAELKSKNQLSDEDNAKLMRAEGTWGTIVDIMKRVVDYKKAINDESDKENAKHYANQIAQAASLEKLTYSMKGKDSDPALKAQEQYRNRLVEIAALEAKAAEAADTRWKAGEKENLELLAQQELVRTTTAGKMQQGIKAEEFKQEMMADVYGLIEKDAQHYALLRMKTYADIYSGKLTPEEGKAEYAQNAARAQRQRQLDLVEVQKQLNATMNETYSEYAKLLGMSGNWYDKQNSQLISLGVEWSNYQEKIALAKEQITKIYGANTQEALMATQALQNQLLMEQKIVNEKYIDIMNPFWASMKQMTQQWEDQVSDAFAKVIMGAKDAKKIFQDLFHTMMTDIVKSYVKNVLVGPLMGGLNKSNDNGQTQGILGNLFGGDKKNGPAGIKDLSSVTMSHPLPVVVTNQAGGMGGSSASNSAMPVSLVDTKGNTPANNIMPVSLVDTKGNALVTSAASLNSASNSANTLNANNMTAFGAGGNSTGINAMQSTLNQLSTNQLTAQNCGDAVALAVNSGLKAQGGTTFLPRGGLGPNQLTEMGNAYNTPVLGTNGNPVTLDSLQKSGAGTIVRMTRQPGDYNYQYGNSHAETIATNPSTGDLGVASYTAGKGLRWKDLNEQYVSQLPKQTTAVNPFNTSIGAPSAVDKQAYYNKLYGFNADGSMKQQPNVQVAGESVILKNGKAIPESSTGTGSGYPGTGTMFPTASQFDPYKTSTGEQNLMDLGKTDITKTSGGSPNLLDLGKNDMGDTHALAMLGMQNYSANTAFSPNTNALIPSPIATPTPNTTAITGLSGPGAGANALGNMGGATPVFVTNMPSGGFGGGTGFGGGGTGPAGNLTNLGPNSTGPDAAQQYWNKYYGLNADGSTPNSCGTGSGGSGLFSGIGNVFSSIGSGISKGWNWLTGSGSSGSNGGLFGGLFGSGGGSQGSLWNANQGPWKIGDPWLDSSQANSANIMQYNSNYWGNNKGLNGGQDLSNFWSNPFENMFSSGGGGFDSGGYGFAEGGTIDEPVIGQGLNSKRKYTFGEKGKELVTPHSKLNELGGGDHSQTHVHFQVHMNAIDTQTGAEFLMKHMPILEGQIHKAITNNRQVRNAIKGVK